MHIFQNFEKAVDERKRALKELKRVIKERTEENAGLTKELEELNVSVNERRNIHEVNGMLFNYLHMLYFPPFAFDLTIELNLYSISLDFHMCT